MIVPIIIGALGLVTGNLRKNLERIDFDWSGATPKSMPVGNSQDFKKSTRLLSYTEIRMKKPQIRAYLIAYNIIVLHSFTNY